MYDEHQNNTCAALRDTIMVCIRDSAVSELSAFFAYLPVCSRTSLTPRPPRPPLSTLSASSVSSSQPAQGLPAPSRTQLLSGAGAGSLSSFARASSPLPLSQVHNVIGERGVVWFCSRPSPFAPRCASFLVVSTHPRPLPDTIALSVLLHALLLLHPCSCLAFRLLSHTRTVSLSHSPHHSLLFCSQPLAPERMTAAD